MIIIREKTTRQTVELFDTVAELKAYILSQLSEIETDLIKDRELTRDEAITSHNNVPFSRVLEKYMAYNYYEQIILNPDNCCIENREGA